MSNTVFYYSNFIKKKNYYFENLISNKYNDYEFIQEFIKIVLSVCKEIIENINNKINISEIILNNLKKINTNERIDICIKILQSIDYELEHDYEIEYYCYDDKQIELHYYYVINYLINLFPNLKNKNIYDNKKNIILALDFFLNYFKKILEELLLIKSINIYCDKNTIKGITIKGISICEFKDKILKSNIIINSNILYSSSDNTKFISKIENFMFISKILIINNWNFTIEEFTNLNISKSCQIDLSYKLNNLIKHNSGVFFNAFFESFNNNELPKKHNDYISIFLVMIKYLKSINDNKYLKILAYDIKFELNIFDVDWVKFKKIVSDNILNFKIIIPTFKCSLLFNINLDNYKKFISKETNIIKSLFKNSGHKYIFYHILSFNEFLPIYFDILDYNIEIKI